MIDIEHELHELSCAEYGMRTGSRIPTMWCVCGSSTEGESWEEAGRLIDAHIEDAKPEGTT